MTDYKYYEASPHDLRARALWPMVIGAVLVALSFLVPSSQGLLLIGSIEGAGKVAVFLSDTAKVFGISIITLLLVLVLSTRRRLSAQYRLKEAIAIVGVVIIFAGGGAMLNEGYIKPQFDSPRPNVEWLAQQPTSIESGFSVESYYARKNGDERSRYIEKVLFALGAEVPAVIGEHWVTEPGYSFPSGHAYASFFLATFFLFFAVNMAMVTGLAPVVGVPLPLVSYGGSAMLVLLVAFGLVQSAHVHRPR